MSNPLISVLLPVYNEEKYLSQSVDSILNQTYRNFELIIIEPDIDDDRQIYCSWLNEDPSHWSWVEQEDAEVISEAG